MSLRWLALAALLLCGIAFANNERQAEVERRLGALRAELKQLQQAQQALSGQRREEQQALRDAERRLSAATRSLREREAEQALQQAELDRLEAERAALAEQLSAQRAALATLVRSVYALGRHEQIKLLLAQDSIETMNRRLAYHRYLQRDRLAQVASLLNALADLALATKAVKDQAEVADTARRAAEAALTELESERGQRRQALAALERSEQDGQARLRALARDESALKALLETLKDVFADIPRDVAQARPLAQLKGRLPLPAQGRLRVGYAGTLPDGRPSSGWWIEARQGSDVRAIAHGRVAFADWMKGYGLLLILDHGDGFMSLYAGNEALLAEVGDWIAAGQAVATAGESGGFSASGVYFELRKAGRALDPAAWVRR